ncbi:hypothetical protein EON62_03605 [archaeon]|nr:MAG: hypothetical protein EON62_03605 [archaeon]
MGLLRHGSSESASPQRRARGGLSSFGSSIEDSALSGSYSAPSSPVSASAAEADELRAYKPFPIPASTTAGAASDVPDASPPLVAMGYGENILLRRVCDPIPEASVESSSATVWTAVSPHPSQRTATHSSASSTLVVSTHIPFASSTSRTSSPQADAGRARHRGAQSPDASSGAATPMFSPLLCPATWQRVAFGCLLLAQRVVDVHTVTERSNIAAYAYALGLMPTTTRMSVTPKQGTDMVHRCVNSLTYALFALLRRHVTVDLPVFTNIRLEYEMSLRATFTELEINIPPPHATVARGIVANSRKLAQALDARTVQRLAKSRASSSSSHFIGTAASGSLSPRQYATRVGYASSGGGGGGSRSAASGSGPSAATVDAVSVLASVHSRSMKGYSSQLRKASSARSSWMNEQPLDEEDSHATSEGGTSSHAS